MYKILGSTSVKLTVGRKCYNTNIIANCFHNAPLTAAEHPTMQLFWADTSSSGSCILSRLSIRSRQFKFNYIKLYPVSRKHWPKLMKHSTVPWSTVTALTALQKWADHSGIICTYLPAYLYWMTRTTLHRISTHISTCATALVHKLHVPREVGFTVDKFRVDKLIFYLGIIFRKAHPILIGWHQPSITCINLPLVPKNALITLITRPSAFPLSSTRLE